jgi:putative MATE family efflux protein
MNSNKPILIKDTQNNLSRTVFWLAMPVLCEQFLVFLVGFYDTFLSGRISSDATTAIGVGAYVGWMASMMFSLVGTGTTALVARHWGAGEFELANRITNRSIALAAAMGGGVYGFIYLTAPEIAHLICDGDETRGIVIHYLRLDGIGHLFTGVTLAATAALRGSGNMRAPMWILGFVSLLNAVASSILVYGIGPFPAWGIDGIVAGTVIARFTGGVLAFALLYRGVSGLKIIPAELRLRGESVKRILRIGGPAVADGAIMLSGQFLFLMIIGKLEQGTLQSATLAAHFIGIRVEAITYLPAVAWGQAAATLVGQSLGANKPQQAVQIGHAAVRQCSLLAVGITVLFFFGAEKIYAEMHADSAVREIGVGPFQLMAFFQIPLVIEIVYMIALRGAGDTKSPMLYTICGVWGVRLPVAYYCGIVLEGGLFGAWIGMCADILVRAVLVAVRFHRGKWLETRI